MSNDPPSNDQNRGSAGALFSFEHHVQRCASILAILNHGPRTLEEIVLAHFEPNLLKGFGVKLAENEIRSHPGAAGA